MSFRPCRLWRSRLGEVGQFGDVVDVHLAGLLAQLTRRPEPEDQLFVSDGDRGGTVGQDRLALPSQWYATEPGGQRFPAGAFDADLEAPARPVRGHDGGLVAAAIFDTVEPCLQARVFSSEVVMTQHNRFSRQTSPASR